MAWTPVVVSDTAQGWLITAWFTDGWFTNWAVQSTGTGTWAIISTGSATWTEV